MAAATLAEASEGSRRRKNGAKLDRKRPAEAEKTDVEVKTETQKRGAMALRVRVCRREGQELARELWWKTEFDWAGGTKQQHGDAAAADDDDDDDDDTETTHADGEEGRVVTCG